MPDEDNGYIYALIQLPEASSLQRTSQVASQVEKIIEATPGVDHVTTIVGLNLISSVQMTYSSFFFISLKPWDERKTKELQVGSILRRINMQLAQLPSAIGFAFPPPAIPGIGTAGGVTFILEDRSGGTVEFLAENTQKFMAAPRSAPSFPC